MGKKKSIIFFLVLTLCSPSIIFAETVLLKSGKTIEGKLLEKTDKYIKIDFYGVSLTYYFDEIESIDGNKVNVSQFKEVAIDETDPNKIFEKVIAAYDSMQTYEAKGTTTIDMDMGGMKMTTDTEFSILLKKPNLYLISWTQKMSGMVQNGAVWNDGTQPYLYMGAMNAYSKIADDQTALGGATGVSGGAAFTIPSLFLSVFKEQPNLFERLKNPKLERIEQVENEECYVISGSSSVSKKETLWISKSRQLIIKYSRSLEQPEGGWNIPEITDEQLEKTMKAMGQEVTAENKQRMREEMNKSMEAFKNIKTGGSYTELQTQISPPQLSSADFKFTLPQGAVYKESLFDGTIGREEIKSSLQNIQHNFIVTKSAIEEKESYSEIMVMEVKEVDIEKRKENIRQLIFDLLKEGKLAKKKEYRVAVTPMMKTMGFNMKEIVESAMKGVKVYSFNPETREVVEKPQLSPFFTGKGPLEWKSGAKYYGDLKEGRMEGIGILTYANGDKYEGEFKNGKMDGRGIFSYVRGSKYDGEFKEGLPNGRGVLIYANGTKYEGEFKDGLCHGKGICIWTNGVKYEGEFTKDVIHGKGIFTYANGDRYEGEFKNGEINGKGTVIFSNEDKLEGECKPQLSYCKGLVTLKDGTKVQGEIKNRRICIEGRCQ